MDFAHFTSLSSPKILRSQGSFTQIEILGILAPMGVLKGSRCPDWKWAQATMQVIAGVVALKRYHLDLKSILRAIRSRLQGAVAGTDSAVDKLSGTVRMNQPLCAKEVS
ncbi:hypothetical protein [Pseudomonas sp. R3-41]